MSVCVLGVGLGELGVRVRTVSILVTERGTVRGAARAAAGAYDRESCWMDSIDRTCEAERRAAWVTGESHAYAACRCGWAVAASSQQPCASTGRLLAITPRRIGAWPRTEMEERRRRRKLELQLN